MHRRMSKEIFIESLRSKRMKCDIQEVLFDIEQGVTYPVHGSVEALYRLGEWPVRCQSGSDIRHSSCSLHNCILEDIETLMWTVRVSAQECGIIL